MFWIGMAIFVVLTILPLVCARILNSRDGARLDDRDEVLPPNREGL